MGPTRVSKHRIHVPSAYERRLCGFHKVWVLRLDFRSSSTWDSFQELWSPRAVVVPVGLPGTARMQDSGKTLEEASSVASIATLLRWILDLDTPC